MSAKVAMTTRGPVDGVYDWDVSDPVLGLRDIALGRWVCCPTTFYLIRNRNRSGVMGTVDQHGEVVWKRKSTSGQVVTGIDEYGQAFALEIVWDGAQPSPVSPTPIGYEDVEERKPVFKSCSKGLLLGDYQISSDDGWNEWRDDE